MARNGKGEFPFVWIGIALFLAAFWGLVCFGPPFMRDIMQAIFDAVLMLLNV